ncbi:MAG: META domain-containing protein [Beijerinckiaceae bacterium]|nr:META domain-containing protein [Beijerinckiaceae bacterium]
MLSLRIILALVVSGPLIVEPVLAQQSVQDTARARARQMDQQREAERKRGLEKRFPVGVRWVLEDIGGKRPPAGVEATLRVDSTYRASGSAGCNAFSSAMYPAREQTLMPSTPALTRRTCPAPVMAFERAYLQALYSRPNWDQIGDSLILKSRAGVLRFRRSL